MWGLVPWLGIEPALPVLGAWSLSHWTTREVPFKKIFVEVAFERLPYPLPLLGTKYQSEEVTVQSYPWIRAQSPSVQFSSVAQSCLTLQPHESQHARPPCPSPTPGGYSNSCPLSRWCHPTISSCHSLLLLPSIFPSISVFSNESVLCIGVMVAS